MAYSIAPSLFAPPTHEKPLVIKVYVHSNESIKEALARHGFSLDYPASPAIEWPVVNTFTETPRHQPSTELDARIVSILKPLGRSW